MTADRWLQRLAWLTAILVLLLPAMARPQPGTQTQPLPGKQPEPQPVKHTYPQTCLNCHGGNYDNGFGPKRHREWKLRPLDRPEIQSMSDAQLTEAIYDCGGKMPSFRGKLTQSEVRGLIRYIRNFSNTK